METVRFVQPGLSKLGGIQDVPKHFQQGPQGVAVSRMSSTTRIRRPRAVVIGGN